jgi:hypothetical protein
MDDWLAYSGFELAESTDEAAVEADDEADEVDAERESGEALDAVGAGYRLMICPSAPSRWPGR